MTMSIGLFAFPDMEMLDYAGPYQVFATASKLAPPTEDGELFRLVTIGFSHEPVRVRAGATLLPDATITEHPELSCLIIPGGMAGVEEQVINEEVVSWITAQASSVPIIASVCTGAFLLAQTGLLNGLQATTHSAWIGDLRRRFPAITVMESHRWVDAGRFLTAGGLCAGLDLALHIVERMVSRELCVATARRLEL